MKPVAPPPTGVLPLPRNGADNAAPGWNERIGAGQRALARLAGALNLEIGLLSHAIEPGSRPDTLRDEAARLEPAFEQALARIPDAEIAQVLRRRLAELGEGSRRHRGFDPV